MVMTIDIFSALNGIAGSGGPIPPRDPGSITGSAFIQNNMNLSGAVREQNILSEFIHGNIPDFLRRMVPIELSDGTNKITYLVMPDVLSIGSEQDYVRMPMNPHTAQAIADKYDCTLPTRKMCNDIWSSAKNKLAPKPWGPPYNLEMLSTYRIGVHNSTINNQLVGLDHSALTTGHKKDVVLTNALRPNNPNKRVAIYGWFLLPDGKPIQDLNPSDHDDLYADYSHGIRLIANDIMVNGSPMRIHQAFTDPVLSKLLSDEGPLLFTRY
jgi:hypothetical protein